MALEDFSKSAKPRVRLFLSADLIGSTALKQNSKSGLNIHDNENWARDHWLPQIVSFFSKWGEFFKQNWKLCQKSLKDELAAQELDGEECRSDQFLSFTCPFPWKAAGDEIIYQVEISSCAHIILAVLAWQRTARILSKDLGQNYRLHAWVASFPVVNSEILIDVHSSNTTENNTDDPILRNFLTLEEYYENNGDTQTSVSLDFVGPSIDAGFRIGTLSSERKMIISVEMAYLLSGILSQKPYKVFQKYLSIYYDGRATLKGLLSGFGYPVFWLDSNPDDTLNRAEDRLLDKKECSTNDVKDFCLEFIDRVKNPFVVSTPLISSCDCNFCKNQKAHDPLAPELEKLKQALKSRCDLDSRNNSRDGDNETPEDVEATQVVTITPSPTSILEFLEQLNSMKK